MKMKRSLLMGRVGWAMLTLCALALFSPRALAADLTPSSFNASVPITISEYSGASTLTDFPLLVKISEDDLPGFSYEKATTDDQPNIAFFDSAGNLLASECDTWDPSGESLFWVKVPSVSGTATTLTMCWARKASATEPTLEPASVWSNYIGVWHLDEAKDSSPQQAVSKFGSKRLASDGVIGGASKSETTGAYGALLATDYYDALKNCGIATVGQGFTASMWVRLSTISTDWAYLFSTKASDTTAGWGMQFCNESVLPKGSARTWRVWYLASGSGYITLNNDPSPKLSVGDWHKVDVIYERTGASATQTRVYIDGELAETRSTGNFSTTSSTYGFAIGGLAGVGHGLFNGAIDECRLTPTIVNPDFIAADYQQINDTLITFGDITESETIEDVDIAFKGAEAIVINDGKELVLKYTNPENIGNLILPNQVEAWVLAVGGGGAGANPGNAGTSAGGAGGGGAGGYVENMAITLARGTYQVGVGAGGLVQIATAQAQGGDGKPSYLQLNGVDVLRAAGGGGGGILSAGRPGGSGGGGSTSGTAGNRNAGGAATPEGQGNKGGESYHQGTSGSQTNSRRSGAGGGGAGGPGYPTVANNIGANGGDGKESTITGGPVIYAAGGGGGSRTGTGGTGGSAGIGGNGGGGSTSAPVLATAGQNGTGSGGGGGSFNQPGGRGGSGVVIIRIRRVMPTRPPSYTEVGWSGEKVVVAEAHPAYVITLGGETVSEAAATDAGTYVFTATLNEDWTWEDGTTDPYSFTLKINKAQLSVESFTIEPWQIGEETYDPELVVVDLNGNPVTLSNVKYFWGYAADGTAGANYPWSTKPAVAGEYLVRAEFEGTDDFDPPSVMPSVTFTLWAGSADPDVLLGYHTDVILSGTGGTGTEQTIIVRVSEGSPKGFTYSQALADGSDIRFYVSSAPGAAQLPSTIVAWNPGGESTIRVKVPRYEDGPVATMCWGPLEGWTFIAPEAAEATGAVTPASAWGPVVRTPNAMFLNRWVAEPVLPVTLWAAGDTPDELHIFNGTPAYGSSYFVISSRDGYAATNSLPVEAGKYSIVFVADAGTMKPKGTASWLGLETPPIEVTVEAHSPTSDLAGTAGTATLSGRVLLANNEPGTAQPILDQDYNQTTNSSPAIYWVHEGDDPKIYFENLKPGSVHRLVSGSPIEELCGATNIWQLIDTYLGTTYSESSDWAADEYTRRNRLPYTSTSAADKTEAMHLVMRNVVNAQVVSPCYTNGIGTIYFDAVNGWILDAGNGYKLVVEVVKGAAAMSETIDDDQWQPVTLRPLKREHSVSPEFTAVGSTVELALDVTTGGDGQDDFYRVIVPIDCREPIRFRIRRTTAPSSSYYLPDLGGFILLDNIIVSYPAMYADLEAYGKYDPTKGGKEIIGFGGAWSVPFPGLGDEVKPRAKPVYYTNPGNTNADVSAFITEARLHYRWRYLDQQINDWTTVDLDKELKAYDPMNFKNAQGEALPGDVEFWFDAKLNAPYYKYIDYAGITGFKMSDYHLEEIQVVTNRATGAMLSSRGTDWFVRLREGQSNFEGLLLRVKPVAGEGDEQTVPFEITGNHSWKGYLKTLEATNYLYRIEFLNEQVPEAKEWATNVTYWVTEDVENLPLIGTLSAGTTNSWAKLPVDGVTGYLMFQVDDTTKSISVVHADYMNFNGWNDAKRDFFVGSSTEDDSKSGVSAKARDLKEDFSAWQDMPATNAHWRESFTLLPGQSLEEGDFSTFASSITPNGWNAGQGMWVYDSFKDSGSGRAFQMEGQGRGFIEFSDAAYLPRGLESIAFSARLGQAIDFTDFSHYNGDGYTSLSNYTFTARAALDLNANRNFRGNASLSLVAYYRPGIGCYEFRMEPHLRNNDGTWNKKSHIFSLYKWCRNSSDQVAPICLGSVTNNTDIAYPETSAENGEYLPMYLSVSNDVSGVACIMAGVKFGSIAYNATISDGQSNQRFYSVCYRDSGTKNGPVLTRGTYGVLSSNCEGIFLKPYVYDRHVAFLNNYTTNDRIDKYTADSAKIPFAGNQYDCGKDIKPNSDEGNWYVAPGRMKTFNGELNGKTSSHYVGLQYVVPRQSFSVLVRPFGSSEKWQPFDANIQLEGFGSVTSKQNFLYNLYTNANLAVRVAVDGKVTDIRRDVVIDDLELRQFRNAEWNDEEVREAVGRAYWHDAGNVGGLTNFVFNSGWIKDGGVMLSKKRTRNGEPSGIRSPVFDDYYNRGVGLGMVAFTYKNAQENVKLLLQIATNNIVYSDFPSIDKVIDESIWTTVTNYDFRATGALADQRAAGTLSCYLGLHGVPGAMRLIVDPETVVSQSNTDYFGEILITGAFCRDEPSLDQSSWWGWNLRTVDLDVSGSKTNSYQYLPDASEGDPSRLGLSLALNNSITVGVTPDETERLKYKEHLPFVQTPTFATNLVGEVSFRARKYDVTNDQPAQITVFGSRTGDEHGSWTQLNVPGTAENGVFIVSNNTYTTYTLKTKPSEDPYRAFRFVVTGVEGVSDPEMGNNPPLDYDESVRVLIDEIVVSEAVRARMGVRNVGAFRNDMSKTTVVPNVPSEAEQPLCNEGWGVQCEVYAAQLADEIDLKREPRVRLHWFEGTEPWGYSNWRTNSAAHSVWLVRATETDEGKFIYRSTYAVNSGESVIPAKSDSGTIQYMLEVEYYQVNQPDPVTDFMTPMDWVKPRWYDPVDYDRDYGKGEGFAAYCILDTVAPHWAWLNEINVFGGYTMDYSNLDKNHQYVEIAAPAEADLSGWYVNLIAAQTTTDLIVTNRLGTFGDQLPKMKNNLLGAASNMVFHVLASPGTLTEGLLKKADGTLDGIWDRPINSTPSGEFGTSGEVFPIYPVGFQLVRKSGIVEHEVLTMGTNMWADVGSETLREENDPSNTVAFLNRLMPGAHFFFAGEDNQGKGRSVGVFLNRGGVSNEWNNTMIETPGRINQGQQIDPDVPTPNGEEMVIRFNVDQSNGPIYQTIGTAVLTNGLQVLSLRKGRATNVTYRVGTWLELAPVSWGGKTITPEAEAAPAVKGLAPYSWTVTVGGPAYSNNLTVVASAQLRNDIDAYINDARFRPAIIEWLRSGRTARGEFAGGDEVKLADFIPYGSTTATPLSLTEMYWLDMDPTVGDLAFVAGVSRAPLPKVVTKEVHTENFDGTIVKTNVTMDVFMMITNRTTDVASDHYGEAWRPYMIRGLDYATTSADASSLSTWNSATFKITGVLLNGKTDVTQGSLDYLPIRWFVFNDDSFGPLTGPRPFEVNVEVVDPHSPESPGYEQGWKNWPDHKVYFGWAIDMRRKPEEVEMLKKENTLP